MDKENSSVHTEEYNSAIKRNEVLTQATTWMDFNNVMPREARHKGADVM